MRQLPLAIRAQAMWERFEELTGEGCEVSATGHLYAAREDAGRARRHEVPAEARWLRAIVIE